MSRWPLHKTWFWERAPFFRVLVPFVAGIICYDAAWQKTWPLTTVSIILIAALGSYFALLLQRKRGNASLVSFLLMQVIFLCSGISICYFDDVRNNKEWYGNVKKASACLLRISDLPAEKETTWKLPVTIVSNITDGHTTPATGKAFIYLHKDKMPMLLHSGDSIWVPAKWQPIQNAANPYEFDYAAYCRHNNIYHQQFCSYNDLRLYSTNDPGKESIINIAHDFCAAQLESYLPDPKVRGLIQAMLLGDETNLDEEMRQAYADTGIVHIIAISGSNVMVFFVFITFILRWMKNKKHMWIKFLAAVPLIWFYVIMAGASPSAIRAAIMFSLFAFGNIFQKNNNSLNQLFTTSLLLLCAQPMWLYAIGFQLSFAAVLSIIIFYRSVNKLFYSKWWLVRKVWQTIAASVAAEVLIAPVVIYYFHNFPMLFIVANVIAFLFMEVVLLMSMALIAFSWLPALAAIIGTITVWLVTTFNRIIDKLQHLNPLAFHYLQLSVTELIVLYAGIASLAIFAVRRQKPALFAGMGAICILLALACNDEWERQHQQYFVAYNTGNVNHMEMITGDKYAVLRTDTTAAKKITYATRPAHTYWQAWQEKLPPRQDAFYVNGKRIVILDSPSDYSGKFPADYVIVNYTGTADPGKLQETFAPATIVTGNNQNRKQMEEMGKIAAASHIPIYFTGKDGALVVGR